MLAVRSSIATLVLVGVITLSPAGVAAATVAHVVPTTVVGTCDHWLNLSIGDQIFCSGGRYHLRLTLLSVRATGPNGTLPKATLKVQNGIAYHQNVTLGPNQTITVLLVAGKHAHVSVSQVSLSPAWAIVKMRR